MPFQYFLLLILSLFPVFSQGQKNDSLGNFGKASFYHDSFHGQETSNGEMYDKDDFTAAHRSYPFNTILLVTNKKNNKSVVVRVNDRGPFKKSRIIDLSRAAAKKIGMVPFGVVQVRIKVMNFLNPGIMNDTLLKVGEVWDCYGNLKTVSDTSIFIWKTQNWKHAFYMASCLSLDYNLNSLYVAINESSGKKTYNLFISDIEKSVSLNDQISKLKNDGFFQAKVTYNYQKELKPRVDQSTK